MPSEYPVENNKPENIKTTAQHESCVNMVMYSQKRSRQDCV